MFNFRKFFNVINPQPLIGGLEVGDSDLKFLLVKGSNFVSTSVKLPVGTIIEGKIKDKESFKASLLKLHSQITPKQKKKIYAVLNISDADVYTQTFNLPAAAAGNLEEAARLNLQMISPTDFSTVYADWQKIGEIDIDGGQLEILGAFANRQIIDDYVECLKETNFVVAAVEFSSLAISRLVSKSENGNPFILFRLDAGGLSFSLIKNNNLYFNRFVSWPATEERSISLGALKDLIVRETQRVLNFAGKFFPQDQIKDILLIAPALEDKISQIIAENFSVSSRRFTLESTKMSSDWFGVFGSASRGLTSRAKDIFISLASVGTEEEFRRHRIINFIKIWRNIILTSFSFVLMIFIAADIFLAKTVGSLNNQIANLTNQPDQNVFNKIEEDAKNFNAKIELALKAKNQVSDWAPFLEKIKNLTGGEIEIDRIFIQSKDAPILFNGRAASEKAIIDFKTVLEKEPEFKEINLPLAGIVPTVDGKFQFSITFEYVKL
jgi:hypothetical protein